MAVTRAITGMRRVGGCELQAVSNAVGLPWFRISKHGVFVTEGRQSLRTGPLDLARRECGDLRVVSETDKPGDKSVDSTDEQEAKSGSFRAPDINPLRES